MRTRKIAAGAALVLGVLTAVVSGSQAPRVYTTKEAEPPQLVREVKPVYTDAAKAQGIQGSVGLEAVVLADGTVGDVRVTRSLDQKYGLDEEAVKALKQWVFRPGTKDGNPVAVQVDVEMTFTIK